MNQNDINFFVLFTEVIFTLLNAVGAFYLLCQIKAGEVGYEERGGLFSLDDLRKSIRRKYKDKKRKMELLLDSTYLCEKIFPKIFFFVSGLISVYMGHILKHTPYQWIQCTSIIIFSIYVISNIWVWHDKRMYIHQK